MPDATDQTPVPAPPKPRPEVKCESCGRTLVWLKHGASVRHEGPFCLKCDRPFRMRLQETPWRPDVDDKMEVLKP